MHGAAQIANAPPSRTREPRLRAPWTSPAPTSRSGHGRRPMNASPKTTRTNPAIRSSRNWSWKNSAPMQLGADSERDEDEREAEHERDAREHHPPGRPPVAEAIGLDGGDGGEVAGHERQHAGREERHEPGDERDDGIGGPHALSPRSGRAPRPAAARARDRGRHPAVRPHRLASCSRSARAHRRRPHRPRRGSERKQPGEKVEAPLRRLGEDGGTELIDELRLDLGRAVAGGDPRPDVRLHPGRDRRSSTGRASSCRWGRRSPPRDRPGRDGLPRRRMRRERAPRHPTTTSRITSSRRGRA